jgi:predicted MPP superfamily phosphohydrolase
LPAARVRLLINENARLEDGVWIVGVDDPATANDDLPGAVNAVPTAATRLLLAHSPDIVPELKIARFDLVLCGHTHGGQVDLPFLNGAWLKDGPTRDYVHGFYSANGSRMYVNRGIGTTTLPVRVACRPELTVFTLHAG